MYIVYLVISAICDVAETGVLLSIETATIVAMIWSEQLKWRFTWQMFQFSLTISTMYMAFTETKTVSYA